MPSYAERLEALIVPEPNTGCWLWTGSLTRGGYAQIRVGGRLVYVHRVSYEMKHGPIPDGLTLDHLCRVRSCANPDHVQPVTHAENMRRARRSVCRQGHEYDLSWNGGARRRCSICFNAARRKRQEGR